MGDVMTHNSKTDRPRIFKLGVQIHHETHYLWPFSDQWSLNGTDRPLIVIGHFC